MSYNQFQLPNPHPDVLQQPLRSARPVSNYPSQYHDPRLQRSPFGFRSTNPQVVSQRDSQKSWPSGQVPSSFAVQPAHRPPSARLPLSGVGSQIHNSQPPSTGWTPSTPPSSFHPSASYSGAKHGHLQLVPSASPLNSSRRPLPTPKLRPESLPPLKKVQPLDSQIQAPAPSRPAILAQYFSPADSLTSNGHRRPLPMPQLRYAKHASLDLRGHSSNPFEASITDKRLSSPQERLKFIGHDILGSDRQSSPNPSLSITTQSSTSDITSSFTQTSPTKFVPLWKREPQTSLSSIGDRASAMGQQNAVSAPKGDVVQHSDPPDSMVDTLHRSQTSPTRRPLPSPTRSFANGRTLVNPLFSVQALVSTMGTEEGPFSHSSSEEEQPMIFADPEDGKRTPSPQYGIRDLPQRSRTAIVNRANAIDATHDPGSSGAPQRRRPARSATLPQPPSSPSSQIPPSTNGNPSCPINDRGGEQSLTFRLAALGLAEELGSANSTRQLPDPHWPKKVPPLPRPPAPQPNVPKKLSDTTTVPVSRSSEARGPPLPGRDSTSPKKDNYVTGLQKMSEKQNEKPSRFVDLDEAPPPSLRRSQPPARSTPDTSSPIHISGSPPQRQWSPLKSSRAESPNRDNVLTTSFPNDRTNPPSAGPSITVSGQMTPSVSVSSPDLPAISFTLPSPPRVAVSEGQSTTTSIQSPDSQISKGQYGSRHTQVQETQGPKRTLPPVPQRSNGLFCGGCGGSIAGRIVSAMGLRWHPGCFRCTVCNELLEHVSSYEREGKPYCHLDYHEVRITSIMDLHFDLIIMQTGICATVLPL